MSTRLRKHLRFMALFGLALLAWRAGPARADTPADAPALRCDGRTDDRAALVDMIRQALAGRNAADVQLPPGRCLLSGPLVVTLTGNQTLTLGGRGAYATELIFTGDTDGLVVTYASDANALRDSRTGAALHLERLSVVHAGGATGHDGIRIIGDSANAAGTIEPDTTIADVAVRGEAGGGWATNILLQDTANTELRHLSVICAEAQDPIGSSGVGVAIRTTPGRYATRHNLTDFSEWGCAAGVEIGERIQGVSVTGGNFTGGAVGLRWNSGGRQELLAVVNSQFSTLEAGISVVNVQNVQLSNNTFYNQNAYAPVHRPWAAIQLAEVDNAQIVGNGIMGTGTGPEYGLTITNDRVVVAQDRPSTVVGNTFFSLGGPALYAANDTANLLFSGNAIDAVGAVPPVALGPGTSVAFSGNRWAGVLYLAGYPGSAGFTLSLQGGAPVGTHWPQGPAGLPPGALWVDANGLVHAAR